MGPAARLGESIGDVTAVEVPTPGEIVDPFTPLCTISWEGYGQTEGDELYHTVWSNVEGTTPVTLPFRVKVVASSEVPDLAPVAWHGLWPHVEIAHPRTCTTLQSSPSFALMTTHRRTGSSR